MPTINKLIQPYVHAGPALALTDPALGPVAFVYRSTLNGQGWISARPGAPTNPFTSLLDGEGYVLVANSVPYTLPDLLTGQPNQTYILSSEFPFEL